MANVYLEFSPVVGKLAAMLLSDVGVRWSALLFMPGKSNADQISDRTHQNSS